jgi:hypothetical protein
VAQCFFVFLQKKHTYIYISFNFLYNFFSSLPESCRVDHDEEPAPAMTPVSSARLGCGEICQGGDGELWPGFGANKLGQARLR